MYTSTLTQHTLLTHYFNYTHPHTHTPHTHTPSVAVPCSAAVSVSAVPTAVPLASDEGAVVSFVALVVVGDALLPAAAASPQTAYAPTWPAGSAWG